MSKGYNRRDFLKSSLAASGGVALSESFEERVLLARLEGEQKGAAAVAGTVKDFPKGEIGDVSISRVICGGNLISGFAHSRDLIYVSTLLKNYFTDEKVFETFHLCEANGINTAMLKFDDKTLGILRQYWQQEGGNIQWISQICSPDTMKEEVQRSVDEGAVGIFTTGQMGDVLVAKGRVDLLAETVTYAQDQGVIAGVSCHELAVIRACEAAGIKPDFYMKTFNSKNYWSARIDERHDNVFNDEPPEETASLMKGVDTPWVAFKVLGAGAIDPKEGLTYAFENGADFACVGMFDFQVEADATIAREVIAKAQDRPRVWHG